MNSQNLMDWTECKRIVVKLGSALLVEGPSGLRHAWLKTLVEEICNWKGRGSEVLVVSSGAIALGRRGIAGLPADRKLKLPESQAAAAMGQIELGRIYAELFGAHGIATGQVLLTSGDTETRRRYLNARDTVTTLLNWGAVPVVNENDTVATQEIRYGDNDRLAARVATMVGADLLILLSDVDGLYDRPPGEDGARHVSRVARVTPEIEAMAGASASLHSRGGMRTKIEAAKIATRAGTAMIIGSGKVDYPLTAMITHQRYTWFEPAPNPVSQRKKWISGGLDIRGKLTIDAGACAALENGKSLLPVGVLSVSGDFQRGDTVQLVDPVGRLVAQGLIEFDRDDAERLAGVHTEQIESILGAGTRAEMIHRDGLVWMPLTDATDQRTALE